MASMAEVSIEEFGALLRSVFAVLHGGHIEEPAATVEREAGETLETYLARSRRGVLGQTLRQVRALTPPGKLQTLHTLLTQLLECAIGTDEALAAQMQAYGCNDFQTSEAHFERVNELVARSAKLDRELILALGQLKKLDRAALEAMGIEEVLTAGPALVQEQD